MGNLIKYEFKGIQKHLLATCSAVVLFNIYLLTRLDKWSDGALMAFLVLEFVAVFVLMVAEGVRSMSRDLYGDTGYLLFSLPQKGHAILAAKIVPALVELAITSMVVVGGAYIVLVRILSQELLQQVIANYLNLMLFSAILMLIVFTIIMIIADFSLLAGRTTIGRRKGGKLISFVIFGVLAWGINWLSSLVIWLTPYTVSLSLRPVNYESGNFSLNLPAIEFNIAATLTVLLIQIALFAASAYLIDHKLDV